VSGAELVHGVPLAWEQAPAREVLPEAVEKLRE